MGAKTVVGTAIARARVRDNDRAEEGIVIIGQKIEKETEVDTVRVRVRVIEAAVVEVDRDKDKDEGKEVILAQVKVQVPGPEAVVVDGGKMTGIEHLSGADKIYGLYGDRGT
jgi:hypothetical protein